MIDILVVLLIVILAIWLGVAYSPLFWLILILAAIWLFARRGSYGGSGRTRW